MITALVQFPLPKSMSANDAKALFEGSAPKYKGLPGLVRKYYLFGEGVGGGCYLWESREAAEKVYSAEWRRTIKERYGAEPNITYFETPVIVENG
jgi:hypothetical protein